MNGNADTGWKAWGLGLEWLVAEFVLVAEWVTEWWVAEWVAEFVAWWVVRLSEEKWKVAVCMWGCRLEIPWEDQGMILEDRTNRLLWHQYLHKSHSLLRKSYHPNIQIHHQLLHLHNLHTPDILSPVWFAGLNSSTDKDWDSPQKTRWGNRLLE